ncbi:MAG: GDP-mannose 4,6-dehydratase [Planctomycetota bacterium]
MAFWKDRKVFVTGATGLLGSWLVDELLNRGANVTCLIRDWVGSSKLIGSKSFERVNTVRGELEDYQVLLRSLNEYEIDTVFHLGAQTIVGTASRSALSTFESNIKGTWNLMEACRVCSKLVKRVIVASSDKAYGVHDTLPYTEDAPLQGKYPYDVSKSCADLISNSYFHTYQVPVAVTRCGNLFGGGDLNFNRLIPGTIRSALQDENPIVRSDGKFIRDYFYVCDAVDAYLQLAEKLSDERFLGHAFNFGTETPMSVLEIVNKILEIMGRKSLSPEILNEACHEIPEQYLDCSKVRQMLGWKPKYTLEEALENTIEWYKKRLSSDIK